MFNRTKKTVTAFEAQSADLAFDAKKAQEYADLSAEFAEHQRELQKVTTRMDQLQNTSRGGGFPWTLLLLIGGAVALYRSNETVRTQVSGLLSRVMPAKEGEQPQGTPQASVGTPTPTVGAGMTPGQSGNEAYGMAGSSVDSSPATSRQGDTGSSQENQNVNTNFNSKSGDKPRS